MLATLGLGLAVVGVLLAGQSLTKDIDHRTAPYIYALPINSQSLFSGRFVGTFLTVLALALFEMIGLAVAPFFGPGRAGPVPILALGQAFLGITVLQLFTLVGIAYSLTVLLRGIRGAYLTLFIVEVFASKTDDDGLGHKTDVLIDDLVPIVLCDKAGHEVVRKLVRPAPYTKTCFGCRCRMMSAW